jgi:hypothetical protein
MKILSSRIFWGIGLVIGGVLLLLDTFGIFEGGTIFWVIVGVGAGLLFLSLYFSNRDNWWALIPGIIFLTIGIMIGLNAYLPIFNDLNLSGPFILGGIALSFLLVYFAERSNWWAIIPAGMMTTIAVVAIMDSYTTDLANGGIFFLGLGLTFAVVALLPTTDRHMNWAWIPAIILGIMGILIFVAAENLINYIWPSALIFTGIILITRSLRKSK